MNFVATIWRTSVGKKYLMAITGLGLFGFVIGHLAGNLQVFLPDDGHALNRYAHFLKSTPEILWPARIGLLVFVGVHIWTAISLTLENRAARRTRYAVPEVVDASYASRTMAVSGGIVLSFILYHLLHFTTHTIDPSFANLKDGAGHHDVRAMIVAGFSNPWAALFYLVGVGLLCWHLSHGVSAMFQSLGLKTPAYEKLIDRFALVVALVLFAGYASIPVAVFTGLVK
jgi:succinate dehydrogenase / fumarate reductase cytochrome b subunit